MIPEWRSPEAELISLEALMVLAARTGARTVAAHVSHAGAVQRAVDGRGRGAQLSVESCPQYFSLFAHEVVDEGAFRKFTPPARARSTADLGRMWESLARGEISYIATDHAPATREQKQAGSIWDAHFGLPGLDTTLSVLLDAAANGRISYEQVVEAYAEAPARTYGLTAKGRLAQGADADIVLVDPAEPWTVDDADIISRAGWSPFAGRTLIGRAVRTYVRGRLASAGGEVVASPGQGRFVAAGAAAAGAPTPPQRPS